MAADQGHAKAQYNLGLMYDEGRGVPQSDTEAVKWYRKAADQGHAKAQYNLGWMYRDGRGVAQDDSEAAKWYRMAADQENARAQNSLGVMYQNGRGVPQSDTEAVKWYRKAADQGEPWAQNNLGLMYDEGRGVPQSDTEAVKWYRKAADQGHAKAQYNLGWMYRDGRGVAQDDSEAAKWYRMAADQGNPLAQKNLGWMYEEGRGVQRDYSKSMMWYMMAAKQGDEDAKHCVDQLKLNWVEHSQQPDEMAGSSNPTDCIQRIESKDSFDPDYELVAYKHLVDAGLHVIDHAQVSSNVFIKIFTLIPYESFVNNPRVIISYMMDYGFSRVQIRLLDTVLSFDSKRFIDLLSCSDEEIDSNTRLIADYCLIDYATLKDLVVEIRLAIKSMNSQSQFSHST